MENERGAMLPTNVLRRLMSGVKRAGARPWMLGVSIVVSLASMAGGAHAESLQASLAAVLAEHPQVQAAEKALAASDAAITGARSGYLPSVRVFGDAGWETIDSPTRRTIGLDDFSGRRETGGVAITQNLFDGFATTAAVDAARLSREASAFALKSVRQNVLLEAVTAYAEVLRNYHLVALGRDNQRNIMDQMRLEDERVKRGKGLTVDVLQAKQRLQVAKERRVAYEGSLAGAVARYQRIFGQAPALQAMEEMASPMAALPAQLEAAIERAVSANPAVKNTETQIAIADERRQGAEAEYYPVLDLVGRANYESDNNLVLGRRRDVAVLLQAKWELFSGYRTEAAVAQASLNHAASHDNHAQATRVVIEQTRAAWHALETARQRLDLLENAVALAEEVWAARRKQREAGAVTVMDVLDAESAIYSARINHIIASYDMKLAAYQLLHAMGMLEPEALTAAPGTAG